MTYVRGAATAVETSRAVIKAHREEAVKLYAEGQKLAETVRRLRERNANLENKIAEETERLEDRRATLQQALADLQQAQRDAQTEAEAAEDKAALIRELAHDQARALAERAYATGYSRGKDHARAKHALLHRVMPDHFKQKPQQGVTNRVHIPA